jgi:hypothetical protein
VKYQYPPKLVEKINAVQKEVLEKFKHKEFDQYLNYDLIYYQSNKDKNG